MWTRFYITPTRKEDTRVWLKEGEPASKIVFVTIRWKKFSALRFGIIEAYSPSISKKMRMKPSWIPKNMWQFWRILKKIGQKRPSFLSSEVILQHNNSTPYSSKTTSAKITLRGWSVFLHSTNSPDLTPSFYHRFPKLKRFLGDKEFTNNSAEMVPESGHAVLHG